jgi:hypothetical protein
VNLPTQKNKKQASWISVFSFWNLEGDYHLHTYKNPCTWRLQFVQELLTWLHMSIVAGKCWVHKAPSRKLGSKNNWDFLQLQHKKNVKKSVRW